MNILEVRNLSKSYGQHLVLNDISLSIPRNSIYGLLGPNGAGKTTLIRIINQIISHDKGEILLNNKIISRSDIRKLGYLPEERGLYSKMKVGEHLVYLAHLKGLKGKSAHETVEMWLDEFEINDWWNKKIEQLSKGMQQKLQFIIAVMHKPEFVILDEPFTGFDPVNMELIRNKILELQNAGTTFMLSTHRMESVEELCDYVSLIHKSEKVIDGAKHEIKRRYSDRIFHIIYQADEEVMIAAESAYYSVAENKKSKIQGHFDLKIKLKAEVNIHDILPDLLGRIKIYAVNEVIPSMHDIFVKLVKEEVYE